MKNPTPSTKKIITRRIHTAAPGSTLSLVAFFFLYKRRFSPCNCRASPCERTTSSCKRRPSSRSERFSSRRRRISLLSCKCWLFNRSFFSFKDWFSFSSDLSSCNGLISANCYLSLVWFIWTLGCSFVRLWDDDDFNSVGVIYPLRT